MSDEDDGKVAVSGAAVLTYSRRDVSTDHGAGGSVRNATDAAVPGPIREDGVDLVELRRDRATYH